MEGIVGPVKQVTSGIPPLQAHISHLRHLSKPDTAWRILHDRFGHSMQDAKQSSSLLAAYIERGLEFYEGSLPARDTIRPVLQYYAYLNFAVAVILAYRPPNYEAYQRHGVRDRTSSLKTLELSSVVLETSIGAVTKFHRILSDAPLRKTPFRLRELAVAIPMLSLELHDAFQVRVSRVGVVTSIYEDTKKTLSRLQSQVQFRIAWPHGTNLRGKRFPHAAIEKAMPLLTTAYKCNDTGPTQATYRSRTVWHVDKKREAAITHHANCLRLINFGGKTPGEAGFQYCWTYVPRVRVLPTMTAALLMSFFLASVFRYRPRLARILEESRLNVLADVFVHEADAFMLPAFRNLLYREEMVVAQTGTI